MAWIHRALSGSLPLSPNRIDQRRAQTLGGGSSFVAVLAISQYFQGAVLRVSCSSPLGLPTALGEDVREGSARG